MWTLGLLTLMYGATLNAEYLSDVQNERIVYQTQGWGSLGIDTAVRPPDGRVPTPLRIKDASYEKGLGHHAPGEIVVELNGEYTAFDVDVGIQQQNNGAASVVFQIFVDDEKRFDSGVMHEADAAKPVHVSVEGADTLRLVATDAGDGIMCDCADWANARLTRAEKGPVKPPAPPFDIAPFGRVVSWDPARMDGTHAKRTDEFPAEDVFLETPVKWVHERYVIPLYRGDRGCIGLQWAETRLLRSLSLVFDADTVQVPEDVAVQCWTGESPWQGQWLSLKGEIQAQDNRWTFAIDLKKNPDFPRTGVDKVRWVFGKAAGLPPVKQLVAYTRSNWSIAALRLEMEEPLGEGKGHIEAYNGVMIPDPATPEKVEMSGPLRDVMRLNVKYSRPRPSKADRTVLRVQTPKGACGIAVEDVLALKHVYVPAMGIYVVPDSDPTPLSQYRDSLADHESVLDRVREMPDQSLEQALAHTHNPAQNNGPMMLSLACDNRKVIVQRGGLLQFEPFGGIPSEKSGGTSPACRMTSRFGSGDAAVAKRGLRGAWLPAHEIATEEKGVVYRQCTFVAPAGRPLSTAPLWLYDKPVCVVEYTFEGRGEASLKLGIERGDHAFKPEIEDNGLHALFVERGQTLAYIAAATDGLRCTVNDKELTIAGRVDDGQPQRCTVFVPLWEAIAADYQPEADATPLFNDFREYWERALADAMQIDVPDALLANIIRASQVHCLLAARNERDGETIAAWIASDRYGPLESEAHAPIYGMDLMGQGEYARRSLDFFVHRYSASGFLTTGYTLMGTGWHLWTLARHQALWQDRAWFSMVSPKALQLAQWIERQCEKTHRGDAPLEETPEYGLVPPGVGADWNRFAYRFAVQAHYYAGLKEIAEALTEAGSPMGGRLAGHAEKFRDDILRAYQWNQARTPVWPLFDGLCIPAYSGMLYGFGTTGEMVPGEDGNRSWAYDVELGAHHLIPLGIIPPNDPETARIMDHMEDLWFLHAGMGDYPAEKNQADWFNMGGFSKVQPYYTRNAEICALRDDVKPFIRSYFNALASQVSLENLSLWEHFNNIGAWNKTHETGWFLVQTRTMFVTERGNELWLAPFVPNRWLEDGRTVSIQNAPTRFGAVSCRIASSAANGYVEATIDAPRRAMPDALVLRLRHPQDLPMKSVTVNGAPCKNFDPSKATIRIELPTGTMTVRANY